MMDFYKYRLLGHKPSQLGPKASEDLGSALGLQDTQAAPTPGVCCGTLHREGLGSPPWALRARTQAVQWSADFLRQDWGRMQVMACAACPYLHQGGISEPVWADCMTLSATKQTTTSCLHRSVTHLRDCLPGLSQPGAPKTQIFMNGACSPSLLPALHSPMAFSLPVVPDYR